MIRAAARSLLAGLLLAAPARAASLPSPVASDVRPVGYRVHVPLGTAEIRTGDVEGVQLSEISLPGAAPDAPAGAPQLPLRVLRLRVPWGVEARVRVEEGPVRPLGALRPVPMPGLLSDPALAARIGAKRLRAWLAGPAYSGEREEEEPLLAAQPSAAGRERFLMVVLRPIRWDARSGLATALESVDLTVSWDRPVAPVPEAEAAASLRGSLAPVDAVGPFYAPAPAAPSRPAAPAAAPLRVAPGRPWLRLGVTRPGLYVLSPADLAAAGVAVAGIDPATFRLFRARPGDLPESVDVDLGPDSLRECAIAVTGEGDGSFDSADRVYFYATGSTGFGYDLALGGSINYEESLRSGEESLWLTWGAPAPPGGPARMTARAAAPVSAAPLLTHVTHRIHVEENRLYVPGLMKPGLRWERWFYLLQTQGALRRFIFPLPGAVPGTAGSLVARAWGQDISVGLGLFDHYLNVSWDGDLVASAGWNASAPQDLAGSGFAVSARDTVDFLVPVVVDPTDPNRLDRSYLAWFEVSYARGLAAVNDTLQFAAPDSVAAGRFQYGITGVGDTSAVWLLDRTDPENPVRLTGGAFTGAAAPFTLTVEDSAGPGYRPRYSLVSTTRASRPATIARYAPAGGTYVLDDLLDPANGADYLIVAPAALLSEAQTLAAYRASRLQGLPSAKVAIATMDRVAAQFGAGLSDPVALRNLVVYARRHWSGPPGPGFSPSYVCLFGDATFDPRNYLGIGAPDWVPTYESYYDFTIEEAYLSDDFFGYLDGDRLLDVAVGRIPARTPEEARVVVEGKTPAYEGATALDPWRARALLVADDSWQRQFVDPVGNGHVEQMERKDGRHLAYPIERSKLYLNDYAWADTFHQSKPAAREEFISRVNQGNWLVDYVGHGAEDVLADEQLFRNTDAGRLTNASRPSIFAFVSCTVGKFDEPGSEGMGELLLKIPGGGSAASLAATAPVFPTASTALNDALVDALFPLAPRADSVETLGFAWARAKNSVTGGAEGTNTRKYQLLGDPAITPPVPRGRGVWEKAPLDSLLRGEVATLSGRALYSDSTFDSTAAGTALIQVQGPPFLRSQVSFLTGGPSVTNYEMPGPVLYRGEAPLQNGRFSVTFVTPTDGRVSGRGGQIRALLGSAGGRGVGLAVDSIRIGQGLSPRVDATPPTLSLRYPAPADSAVQAGDRLTIVVEDSSGVDLTRLDHAHSIFVVVDELGAPLELTPGFAYEPGSHTRGGVDWTVPGLAQGPHLLEVHASDTYGNIAVRTFVLDVRAPYAAGDPLILSQVFNYPNPFPRETFVHARLNQPARLRVQILTVAGRRVREIHVDGQAGENYVPWDGKDSRGENVAIGVYLVRVIAETPGGRRATAVGRALRTE